MAFLIDTGIKIVDKLVDSTVGLVIRQVRYIVKYKENLKELEDQVRDLDAAKQSMEEIVCQEKKNDREVHAEVENWLTNVKEITREASKILNREQKKVLCGLCPNLVLRHQQGRNSTKLVPDFVKLLFKRKGFVNLATTLQDYEAFGSRTLVVNQIMDVFRDRPDVNRIGVYGLGGMGKTTLVKEIYHQAREGKLFDDVAMILDVKQNPSIHRIQKEIAEKLKLDLAEDESVAGRARLLYNMIKDQKILIILDDVWEEIDLEAVGVSGVVTCKVLLTSRSLDVLINKMHTQREFQLTPLTKEESWNLFEKMAGEVVKDPAIKIIATKLANKCGGLPVLAVTVASALKNRRTVHAWKDALRRLEKFDKEELTKKTYLALEWSYDQLIDEELKALFLLCGFYPHSPKIIHINDLLKYGIGLGHFENLNSIGEAWDALNSRLEKLKDSCLLLDHETSGCVKMQDLVYDVAKRILSRDQNVLKVSDGEEFKEWHDNKNFFEKCSMISLIMSSVRNIPEVLQCTELKLFILIARGERRSLNIPCNFFEETTKLNVLDLTGLSIQSLPSSLQFLKNLKTLCLDGCTLGDVALIGQLQNLELLSFAGSKFKVLPKEIGRLTSLRSLDLTACFQLELIPPNILSNLEKLEELKMGNSFNRWEVEGVNSSGTEKKNASLSELKHLSKLSCLQVHIKDANMLPTNLFSNALERYDIYIGAGWDWYGADANLNTLKIKLTNSNELYQSGVNILLNRTDELHLNGTDAGNNIVYQLDGEGFQQLKYLHIQNAEFRHIINGKGVFPNLKRLVVCNLDGSRFFLSSSMARRLVQLAHLEISGCPIMEEIISTDESDEQHMKNMFSKLEHLKLDGLPVLTSFFTRRNRSHVSWWPSLEQLAVYDCTKIAFLAEECLTFGRNSTAMSHTTATNQALFLINKDSFPNLKRLFVDYMEIWDGPFPVTFFSKLETLQVSSNPHAKSTSVLEKFLGFDEISFHEKGGLHHLNTLWLSHVPLMHLGEDSSQLAGQNFPNLVVLGIYYCDSLRNLRSSAISFKNLTVLKVTHCPGLEYLITFSTAESLIHLKRLGVEDCKRLEAIVASAEVDSGSRNEIVFSQLISLELRRVPRFLGFFSGHQLIVKFPSLETISMSKLLQLKIFHNDETRLISHEEDVDSDIDVSILLSIFSSFFNASLLTGETAKKIKIDADPGANSEQIDEIGGVTNGSEDKNADGSFLKGLKTLFLERCTLGDIAVIVQLQNLEMLSFQGSKFKELPKEIGQLTYLRWLDLTDCSQLELIPPNVLSSLERLEELRMCNSFYRWQAEGVKNTEKNKASLSELKYLAKLSCLQIHILDAGMVPTNLFPNGLKRYQIYVGDMLKWNDADANLNTLKIKLRNNELYKRTEELNLTRMEAGETTAHQQLKHLHIHNAHFEHIIKGEGLFPNLQRLVVNDLDGFKFLLSSSMAGSLVQLTRLEISGCQTMEEIVSTDRSDETNMKDMFSKLKHLELKGLPLLTGFYSRRNDQESYNEIEEMDSRENLGNGLFDEKVSFPDLEKLTIIDLPKLETIWHTQLAPVSCCRLRDVKVQRCNSLKSILPDSLIADVFKLLQKLTVEECEVEEIISQGRGLDVSMNNQFVFPSLKSLEFRALFQLKRFYPRIAAFRWPLLKTIVLFDCNRLDIFASEFSGLKETHKLRSVHNPAAEPLTTTKHSSILINENSFPNLEDLTFGPRAMDIWYGRPTSVLCCEKAVFAGISNRDADRSFPHLRTLRLHGMEKLMRLWKTQPAGQHFPLLEILELKFCGLNNLELSAISFQNLTSLELTFCWRLQYLTTYTVAQNLRQLEALKVDECKNMKQILASDEGIGEDLSNCEIVFSQLEHLELSDLISLECFCSSNCTVKVPKMKTLEVKWCSIKLTVSSDMLQVDSDVKKSHYTKEEQVRPLEPTPSNQGLIEAVKGNLSIIPIGEVRTPVFPVTESPPVAKVPCIEEVGEQPFSCQNIEPLAEEASPDVHKTPKAPDQPAEHQTDPLERSSVAIRTPPHIIHALSLPSSAKPSGQKRSLREKIQDLSATSSSALPEKAKVKALIATADLKDPHIRQHLLEVLPTLQVSTTKWIVDLVVQELLKLPMVLDKEESLCKELAALKAQASELDVRSQILLSECSLDEERIENVQEQKVELLALKEHNKKLEAQATSLRAEVANGEKKYSSIEASLDELVEEKELNQVSVDLTSHQLLITRAVSDRICTAIFTYLRQLF